MLTWIMFDISLAIISTKDNERTIVSTIVKAKERFGNVVIVDLGSSDRTIELAEMLNVEVLNKDKMNVILLGFKKFSRTNTTTTGG